MTQFSFVIQSMNINTNGDILIVWIQI